MFGVKAAAPVVRGTTISTRLASSCPEFYCYRYRSFKPNIVKAFTLFLIIAFFYVFWLQYTSEDIVENVDYTKNVDNTKYINEKEIQHKFVSEVTNIDIKDTQVPKHIPSPENDLKFILLWTPDDWYPFDFMGKGQQQFIKYNCSIKNCYVTSDKNYFNGDLTKFHAIAFNGRNMHSYTKKDFPSDRSYHQKYIYFNTESAENESICSKDFDNMFNWTATYKLNSDILFSYIGIKDTDGIAVGPKPKITWVEDMDEVDDDYAERLQNKSKAAAWFVSHCHTRSKREEFANKLQKALKLYDLNLDVYGACGPLKCPRGKSDCDIFLERDYYFYMSMENSFAEDYVTEKLLTAVQHDTVPIVYGGADYSRFLPPGSYINAREYSPTDLAAYLNQLIRNPKLYRKFFRWKKYYTYNDRLHQNVCDICEVLNNRTKFETISVYNDIKKWWNTNENKC